MAIQLSPLLLGLLACAALIYVVYATWGVWGVPLRVLTIALAAACPIASLVYMVSYEHFLPSLYHRRRVMKVLGSRTEPFVDPADAEARWVEVIPRAHWVKAMAQNASDVGVLKVDRQRGAILFEGDRERWAIPAESVLSCEVETFTALGQEPNHLNVYSVVVLAANVDGRPWEAPLYAQSAEFCPRNSAYRKKRAEELRDALASVLPTKEA